MGSLAVPLPGVPRDGRSSVLQGGLSNYPKRLMVGGHYLGCMENNTACFSGWQVGL